jgi:hypothetical protein
LTVVELPGAYRATLTSSSGTRLWSIWSMSAEPWLLCLGVNEFHMLFYVLLYLLSTMLAANLPQLQNFVKRDPAAYKEEFLQQWNHYISIRQIFEIYPGEQAEHFRELITFIAQVSMSCNSEFLYMISRS